MAHVLDLGVLPGQEDDLAVCIVLSQVSGAVDALVVILLQGIAHKGLVCLFGIVEVAMGQGAAPDADLADGVLLGDQGVAA